MRIIATAAALLLMFVIAAGYYFSVAYLPPGSLSGKVEYEPVPDSLDWSHYGGDAGQSRFTPHTQINSDNVRYLQQAWVYHTGALTARPQSNDRVSFQLTPLLAAGSLIGCTPFNRVFALNPATGEERWSYRATLPEEFTPSNTWVCRGVVSWDDPALDDSAACKTRIFTGTNDLQLIALDARTGELCRDFAEEGIRKIDIGAAELWPGEVQLTSAPAVAGDVVIVGSAIGDNARVAAPFGTVRAYDVRSGALRWTFDPLENARKQLLKGGLSTELQPGHANVWGSISVDQARNLVYLPTSSPSPDFWGGLRPGDNRYANSVVALNGTTGEIQWHFQIVHHDLWDYDLPAGPSFVTLEIDGKPRDALVQASKQSLLFVLDRETGEPLIPVEERPVPQSAELGEAVSPSQPFPVQPPPLVPMSMTAEDAWGLTPFDRGRCRERIAAAGDTAPYTPPDQNGLILAPFTGGGTNWGGVTVDQHRKIVVANVSNLVHFIRLHPKTNGELEQAPESVSELAEFAPMRGAPFAVEREMLSSPLGLPCNAPPWGLLAAFDLQSREILWSAPFGTSRGLAGPLALPLGLPNLGGAMTTASGLTFIGAATDGYLRAFETRTGKELWGIKLPGGGQATPMSYSVGGRQHIVIAAGGHAWAGTELNDTLVAYALPAQ